MKTVPEIGYRFTVGPPHPFATPSMAKTDTSQNIRCDSDAELIENRVKGISVRRWFISVSDQEESK
jgi:hypothetical protein